MDFHLFPGRLGDMLPIEVFDLYHAQHTEEFLPPYTLYNCWPDCVWRPPTEDVRERRSGMFNYNGQSFCSQ